MRNFVREMPFFNLKFLMLVLGLFAFAASPQSLLAAQSSEAGQASVEEVKRESAEAIEAIQEYSAEQREEVVAEVEQTLDKLDMRIAELEGRVARKSAEFTDAVREKTESQLAELRRQRNKLAEWYGGMKHSSEGAWDRVKDGFVEAYGAMADSLEKAWEEL